MALSSAAPHASQPARPTGPAFHAAGWLVLFGAALTLAALAANSTLSHESIWGRDFRSFYESAAALAAGGDPYERSGAAGAVNVNLPHVIAFMVPLTFLSPVVAFVLWQAIQIGAWAFVVWGLFARGALRPTPETLAALVLFPGTLAQLALGQWAFALALLVALAWSAHRAGSAVRAGLWIGAATAIKPFMAILLVALAFRGERRTVAVAVLVGAAVLGTGFAVLGPDLYLRWVEVVRDVTWADLPLNASLVGFAERTLPSSWTTLGSAGSTTFVLGTTLAITSNRLPDALWWTFVLTAALLCSPLGWVYYVWILTPSLVSLPSWSRTLNVGLGLLWLPPGLMPALSTATVGLLVIWVALALDLSRAPRAGVTSTVRAKSTAPAMGSPDPH